MDQSSNLLIVVDPGHGGWDNGASWEGRLEKDDNLRLGLAVRDQLRAQNIPVLMTRESDVFVTLADRASMANEAGASLFVSLHRNSYPEQTPSAMGVENFIYLTAPEQTTGRAARLVLDSVVDVGVQANRGVSRGDYYVLRKTAMPAMLLEMGFIINEIDNQLFDEHLADYAAAIVRGIMQYFGLPENHAADPPWHPSCPICPDADIMRAQLLLDSKFGITLPPSGFYDDATQRGAIMALQKALNNDLDAALDVDGALGPLTLDAFGSVFPGSRGNVVMALQLALMLRGHYHGALDGVFGRDMQAAVRSFRGDANPAADATIDRDTLRALLI